MLLIQTLGYALLVPFFGWGIYLLRRRYLYYEESTARLEVATAAFIGVFFWIESLVLRQALSGQLLLHLAAILGLSVAGFALYAHVVISLISRLVVDMVAPGDDEAVDHPRFGPVEALEREGDYEGALQEYLVLARIYPRNVEVLSRTASMQNLCGNPETAAEWFVRARKRASRPDDALGVVNQLCQLYERELDQPEKSDHYLARFIRDFPDSPDVPIVRDRLNRRSDKQDWSVSDFLDPLEEEPLSKSDVDAEPDADSTVGAPVARAPKPELVSLESSGSSADFEAKQEAGPLPDSAPVSSRPAEDKASSTKLTPLSDAVNSPAKDRSKEPERPKAPARKNLSGLEKLEDTAPAEKPEASAPPSSPPKSSGLKLDPMDDDPA